MLPSFKDSWKMRRVHQDGKSAIERIGIANSQGGKRGDKASLEPGNR